MYSSKETVRDMSGFTSDQLSDSMIDLRLTQAHYIVTDYKTADIAERTQSGDLTDKEKFELSLGEAELTVVLLCYTLSLKYTMTKDNKSFSAGNGGVSYRDSQKNLDFLKMAKEYWIQAWKQMSDYVTSIPDAAGLGTDPYTNCELNVQKNYNTSRVLVDVSTDAQSELNLANLLAYLNGEIA